MPFLLPNQQCQSSDNCHCNIGSNDRHVWTRNNTDVVDLGGK